MGVSPSGEELRTPLEVTPAQTTEKSIQPTESKVPPPPPQRPKVEPEPITSNKPDLKAPIVVGFKDLEAKKPPPPSTPEPKQEIEIKKPPKPNKRNRKLSKKLKAPQKKLLKVPLESV